MSEFLEKCYALREICKHYTDCRYCPVNRTHFCDHQPVSWYNTNLINAERVLEEYMKTNPSIGQYLEQHGIFSPDSDDQTKLQALYNTKVPMEWLK